MIVNTGIREEILWENFCRALENLKDIYEYEEPYNNVIRTGLVALYEICFEQSWKLMKELLEKEGVTEARTGSPRQILKSAYQAGMVREETLWMDALAARNNVAHAYNQAVALDIVSQTKKRYYPMFAALKTTIEENWKEQEQ